MTKKRIPPQEMLDDLSKMGDQDFMVKWNVSRIVPIKLRKRYEIQPFLSQHGTRPHEFRNGYEYKWCGAGHWEPVENFGKHSSRYDGLRGLCKFHNNSLPSSVKPRKSCNTRKHNSKRRKAFVSWNMDDENKIYRLCQESCAYCKTYTPINDVEFDHFIPVKLGGKTEPKNMLPSCTNCNRGVGGKFKKEPHEWLIKRFGHYYGEQIYNECVSILEKL